MTSKFTFILVFFLSPIFLQWCHSNEDVFDYIFGDDGDDMFSISKPSPTENPPAKESNKAPVQEFVKQPLAEPIKEPINEPSKKPIKEPSKEPVKELKQDVTQQPLKETGQGSVNKPTKEGTGFTPLGDFLKLGLPFQELAKESPVKLTTEDGKDGPLGQFLNVAQPPEKSKKKKRKRKKKNRSSVKYIMRQVDKLGSRGAPQALMAFSYVVSAFNQGIRGIKYVVDGSTNMSSKTVNTMSNANNSTMDAVQGMISGTANATIRRVNSWADTLDLLRRSMSGSVKKKADKGHSITITTSSDAPVKTLASFVDKWGNGGALTNNGQKGGSKSSSLLPMMPPALPEVTSVDFSNFWR